MTVYVVLQRGDTLFGENDELLGVYSSIELATTRAAEYRSIYPGYEIDVRDLSLDAPVEE